MSLQQSLHFSIVDYLRGLLASPSEGVQVEELEVAVQCLQAALGIPDDAARPAQITNLSLLQIYGLGLAGQQKIEQALADATPATTTVPSLAPMDAATLEEFRQYLNILESKGYLSGVQSGTPDYQQKVVKAQEKFLFHRQQKLLEEQRQKAAEDKKQLGNEYLLAKKYAEAIQAYTEAIDLNPNNAIYYSNRSDCTLLSDRFYFC